MNDMQNTQDLQDSAQKFAGGSKKASVIGIYMAACINATPKIVGLLAVSYPITYDLFGEGSFFQFVVLLESLGASFIYWVNWNNLVSAAVDGIKALRDAKQKIRDATEKE